MDGNRLIEELLRYYRTVSVYSDVGRSSEWMRAGGRLLGMKETSFSTRFDRRVCSLVFRANEPGFGSVSMRVDGEVVEIADESGRVRIAEGVDDAVFELLLPSRGVSAIVPSLLFGVEDPSPLLELTELRVEAAAGLEGVGPYRVVRGLHPRQGDYCLWLGMNAPYLRRILMPGEQQIDFFCDV